MSIFFLEKPWKSRWFILTPPCQFQPNFAEEKSTKAVCYQVCVFFSKGGGGDSEKLSLPSFHSRELFFRWWCSNWFIAMKWKKNGLWVFFWQNFFLWNNNGWKSWWWNFISRSLKKPCQNAALTRTKTSVDKREAKISPSFRWVFSSHWNKMAFQ